MSPVKVTLTPAKDCEGTDEEAVSPRARRKWSTPGASSSLSSSPPPPYLSSAPPPPLPLLFLLIFLLSVLLPLPLLVLHCIALLR